MGITGMSWALADELREAGYDGDVSIPGMCDKILKEWKHSFCIERNKKGTWIASLLIENKVWITSAGESMDTAIAYLLLKLIQ